MNTAIIGDVHFGINPDNVERVDIIAESQELFFNNFLIDELRKNNVSDIIFTGDIFDTRRKIDTKLLQHVIELFKNTLSDFKCHIILGNHDIYFRDSLNVTSLTTLEAYCTVYKSIKKVTINNISYLMTPWIVSSVKDKFKDGIIKQGKKIDFILGHFDMKGVKMESGSISQDGFDVSLFSDNCNYTLSGHYHNISMNGNNNVLYVGTPYQLSFGDRDQARGIWIISEDKIPKFIENTVSYKFIRIQNIEELKKYADLSNFFVEYVIKSTDKNEDRFAFKKAIEVLKPLYLKAYVETIKQVDTFIEDISIENSDVFVEMSKAANAGNFTNISDIYMKIDPPVNPKQVKDLFEEIRILSEK